jgi:hypothetical protein
MKQTKKESLSREIKVIKKILFKELREQALQHN